VIPSHTLRLSYIILTITLTVILIGSPVIAVYSPLPSLSPLPMVLKVGFASATSESGDEDESNTDATTTDDEEGGDGEQQQEDNSQQQLPPAPHETPLQMPPAPHETPLQMPPAPHETPLQMPPAQVPPLEAPPVIVDEEPPPAGEPPADGEEEEDEAETSPQPPAPLMPFTQQGQQPNSASQCPPQPTNYYTAPARIINVQLPPPSSSPSSPPPQTTTNPCPTYNFPGGISITKDNINGIVEASISDSRVIILSSRNGGVEAIEHPDGVLLRTGEGGVSLRLPNANDAVLKLRPDGIGQIALGDTTITGNRDGTITVEKPYGTSTYSLDGKVVTTNPADGTSTSSMIGSVNGGITKFPGGISITKGSDGRVIAHIPDSDTSIFYGPNGGLEFIDHPNGLLSRSSGDGSVSAWLEEDAVLKLRPDGIGEIDLDEDGIFDITGNRDGTLTISKPITDPATGVKTKGASMTTTYKAP
jgi:hypothetical protein